MSCCDAYKGCENDTGNCVCWLECLTANGQGADVMCFQMAK